MATEHGGRKAASPLVGRVRLALWVLAGVLVLIVILQNTESVQTRILFVTVEMPRALLLGLMLAVGFALGVLASLRLGRRKR